MNKEWIEIHYSYISRAGGVPAYTIESRRVDGNDVVKAVLSIIDEMRCAGYYVQITSIEVKSTSSKKIM